MRKVKSVDAARDLDAVIAIVVARFEPVEVTSAWGSAVLIPGRYFDQWMRPLQDLIAIMDPSRFRVDAAANTSRWDRIPELVDTDTGLWSVTTKKQRFVFDLNARSVSEVAKLDGKPAQPGRPEVLGEILECRQGKPASWSAQRAAGIGGPTEARHTEAIESIFRLDERRRDGERDSRLQLVNQQAPSAGVYTSAVAAAIFEELVENVASREDRLVLASPAGRARLVPMAWFEYLQTVVAELVFEIVDPDPGTVDANTVIHEGESVVELRDGDTGVWLVTLTGPAFFIVDLDQRRARAISDLDEVDYDAPWTLIVRLHRCRVDDIIDVEFAETDEPTRPISGAIVDLRLLDAWVYG